MGRWRRRVLCPWLLCALVVLFSIHGSKGNRIRLGIRFRGILLRDLDLFLLKIDTSSLVLSCCDLFLKSFRLSCMLRLMIVV